jgi:hypothetical protein
LVVSYFIVHILNLEIMEINEETKKLLLLIANNNEKSVCSGIAAINMTFKLGLPTLKEITYTKLLNFINSLELREYTLSELKILFDSANDSKSITLTKPQNKLVTKKVNQLKVGDVIFNSFLNHPMLILNVYKSGKFKACSLSSKPDNSIMVESRHFNTKAYSRLTVGIYNQNEHNNCWMGDTSLKTVKLVKLWLQQNKL